MPVDLSHVGAYIDAFFVLADLTYSYHEVPYINKPGQYGLYLGNVERDGMYDIWIAVSTPKDGCTTLNQVVKIPDMPLVNHHANAMHAPSDMKAGYELTNISRHEGDNTRYNISLTTDGAPYDGENTMKINNQTMAVWGVSQDRREFVYGISNELRNDEIYDHEICLANHDPDVYRLFIQPNTFIMMSRPLLTADIDTRQNAN